MPRKTTYQLIVLAGFLFHFSDGIYAQGCSDAGICTIDSFKPHEHDESEEYQNTFKVGLNFGAADYDINVFGTYID